MRVVNRLMSKSYGIIKSHIFNSLSSSLYTKNTIFSNHGVNIYRNSAIIYGKIPKSVKVILIKVYKL